VQVPALADVPPISDFVPGSPAELDALGGRDPGAIANALVAKGTLSAWQYAVRKASNGDLEQAPLRKIAILAHESLRVEPFSTPLKVVPHASDQDCASAQVGIASSIENADLNPRISAHYTSCGRGTGFRGEVSRKNTEK
jgi:hypothetical protein